MARRNAYLQTVWQQVAAARATHTQMCLDAAMLAASEVFHMGPGRAAAFASAFSEALVEIATMSVEDTRDLAMVKTRLDERLAKICGERFQSWEERYEGARDLVHDAAVERLRQRVEQLERELERARGEGKTNGDRLRAMTDEELARLLNALAADEGGIDFCRRLPECDEDLERDTLIPLERCESCLLHWLRQEADRQGGGLC